MGSVPFFVLKETCPWFVRDGVSVGRLWSQAAVERVFDGLVA